MGMDTVPTGIVTGTAGSLVALPVTNVVPATGNLVLAAGVYVLYGMGANTTYKVFDGTAWQTLVAAGGIAPVIYSDGISFRFENAAGANQNAVTQKIG